MDANTLEELLQAEGIDQAQVDELVAWAHERAQAILDAAGDSDLGALLDVRPPSAYRPGVDITTTGRAARTDPAPPAQADQPPLPPIPSAAAEAQAASQDEDIEELDEIELLDDDDLELVEDEASEGETGTQAQADEPSPHDAEPPAPAEEPPSYGPPDGSEHVPEWKAALYSAELGDDRAAAAKIKEESYLGPAPQPIQTGNTQPTRLESEEDEISQHRIDLSDLGD